MTFLPVDEQLTLIERGVEEILPLEELKQKLERSRQQNKPLIVKLGCDPSRPDLHVGHGVVLRKLRNFQDLGHQAVLVIGDFTAMIGDPSGRNKTRPQLTLEDTRSNADSYVLQAKAILDIEKLKIVYNNDWLGVMSFSAVIQLASHYTVARILERDDFTKRLKSEIPIAIHELMYPLAQGMDSVELKADIELGGTDQKFNLLVGRDLQREYDQEPQVIITLPLLEGIDGKEKMSKSYDNHIGLHDRPEDMYGRTLKIPDELIYKYYQLAAAADEATLQQVKDQLEDEKINPRDIKRALARMIVTLYHDQQAAAAAEQHFDNIFIRKGVPNDIPTVKITKEILLVDVLVNNNMVISKSDARRMIKQGAVRLNGVQCTDLYRSVRGDEKITLKVGKRRFLQIN